MAFNTVQRRQGRKGKDIVKQPVKGPPSRTVDSTRINHQIRSKVIRVVADEGQVGIMDLDTAIRLANERDMDLVEISPDASPPVCKIMDYGKFKFEKGKKLRESKKKQATVNIKEIKMRPMIDDHDYEFKVRNIRKFIADGDKVKITIRFRGREMAKPDLGMKVLNRLSEELNDVAKIESQPKLEGKQMIMVLAAV
ncbi:MAG: translation initiation factor IF-3 [Nitrospirae bacterium]|nr:translation initiation factor IF-3 [Nitrospirota bacterium]